jgi:hypothetical protein
VGKERNGFGFLSEGPNVASPTGLIQALFTSTSYDRVIRRIEWSAHNLLGPDFAANRQFYTACLIFAGVYPGQAGIIRFDARAFSFNDPNNNPEILYCQSQATSSVGAKQDPIFTELNFKLQSGRDYTVAVAEIAILDTTTGITTYTSGGRTLNVFGEDLPAGQQHWR